MSAAKFKEQLIPDDPANTVLATCRVRDTLIGQAFATTWDYEPRKQDRTTDSTPILIQCLL